MEVYESYILKTYCCYVFPYVSGYIYTQMHLICGIIESDAQVGSKPLLILSGGEILPEDVPLVTPGMNYFQHWFQTFLNEVHITVAEFRGMATKTRL